MSNIQLKSNIPNVIKSIEDIRVQRMTEACIHVQGKVKEKLSGSRTGRVYKVPGTKHKVYTASAPGEPPAVMLGQLRQSIKFAIDATIKGIVGLVGSDLKKAPMLEYGTSRIKPRPFLRPTFQENIDSIKAILSRKWL